MLEISYWTCAKIVLIICSWQWSKSKTNQCDTKQATANMLTISKLSNENHLYQLSSVSYFDFHISSHIKKEIKNTELIKCSILGKNVDGW